LLFECDLNWCELRYIGRSFVLALQVNFDFLNLLKYFINDILSMDYLCQSYQHDSFSKIKLV